ncbi:MAG TPA: TolC family protein [Saprospiraceae bacterium]|nr:TolC family protein [Saprospiraceae bacterium]MCB9328349.1 TolC family protein [Lewinellaceae bacterium]HRX29959.1 TolC family protein [Saprospiraceae bacterium]
MKHFTLLFFVIYGISFSILQGQSVSIDSCYIWSKQNYPAIKQYDLINQLHELDIEKVNQQKQLQINFGLSASYQSDVTKLPIELPQFNIPTPGKDQYKLYTEISQPLTALLISDDIKSLKNANAVAEAKNLDVEIYKIYEKIEDLFFGTLLIDKQLEQLELSKSNISTAIKSTEAAIENGVALKSNLAILQVQLKKLEQKIGEAQIQKQQLLRMLSIMTGKEIEKFSKLEIPTPLYENNSINRPELSAIDASTNAMNAQKKIIDNQKLPVAGLFLQAGIGRPALNFLSDSFDPYYIFGLKAQWSFNSLNSTKTEKEMIDVSKNKLDIQRQSFLRNIELRKIQVESEIKQYQEQLISDQDIIADYETILETSLNQLKYGTISTSDYIVRLNDLESARLGKVLHEMLLLSSQYKLRNTYGNIQTN